MPLIGGNKYSCEPCIRGHRATHCNHTDRILIEVRKPGRPLDRCAHSIASCTCARHLKNSTVVEVTVRERPISPQQAHISSRPASRKRAGSEDDDAERRGGTKKLLISKEQPFARELRLSSVVSSSSSSSSGDEDSETHTRRPSLKSATGETKKSRVYKRHRLGDGVVPSSSLKSNDPFTRQTKKSQQSQSTSSALFTTASVLPSLALPPISTMNVSDDDEDLEPPALSPSISESGSERTLMASAAEPTEDVARWTSGEKKEEVASPTMTFRSISISELLT